ncbi:group II intron reverse transcriptase/maturase [Flammeovirga aprica]|uniref:Group II intron reverse transcriptase/maturase n=1 Tax=Flammeovirga aprica JL-4 TaxID=694437 RepID=A0A7X9X9D3_9BACT|nr:group II intron reverse transcriptase/maturase [Flammeovirga aprica]NME68800.1 group II intron reverse transcriptase/maturase [Flammeovirga aprica JL-4]
MHKRYSLIDKVYSIKNLTEAFNKVKRNKGSRTKGIDGVTAHSFQVELTKELCLLHDELRSGEYRPQAVRRTFIDKPDGSQRPLGIPCFRDRVVQQALCNILEPIFEETFHPSSYAYRPNRSAHHAVTKADLFMRKYGLSHVVDMDLSQCFDLLDHQEIIDSVGEYVSDGKVLSLIEHFLKSGIMHKSTFIESSKGSPQGGVISPLLANIYLNRFDQSMKSRGIRLVRYADDILLFARTKSEAYCHMRRAVSFLEGSLKLRVNATKTSITHLKEGLHYLGFVIDLQGVRVSPKSVKSFKDKVRKLTRRSQGHYPLKIYIRDLSQLMQGYSMYYRLGLSKSLFRSLQSWIRRRLRMMIMKSWKSWKGLYKQLRRMNYKGTYRRISLCRWRNSNCYLIHRALPDKWFSEQGLFDLTKVITNTIHQFRDKVLA